MYKLMYNKLLRYKTFFCYYRSICMIDNGNCRRRLETLVFEPDALTTRPPPCVPYDSLAATSEGITEVY